MKFVYFLKIIFDISTLKRSENIYKKIILSKNKIQNFLERGLYRVPKHSHSSI
jgi:hypothetical protein